MTNHPHQDVQVTASPEFEKVSVDHIAEKTAGHSIVFDNDVDLGSNDIIRTGLIYGSDGAGGIVDSYFFLVDGVVGKYFMALESGNSETISMGSSASKWKDIWIGGDANIGGDFNVT